MTDATIAPDLLAALQAQLAATQKSAGGWNMAATAPSITGLAVPLKLSTPRGEIRVYLQLPAEVGATPDAIMQALQALDASGYPLDIWQPRDSSGWNRGSNSGGWGRSGGWRR